MKDQNYYRPQPKSWSDVFVALLFTAIFLIAAACVSAAAVSYIFKSIFK